MRLEFRHCDVQFATTTPPVWAPSVDRWYQLDAPAFALAEAWTRWSDLPAPGFIVGASMGASNGSDRAFAEAPRAHRFVHTLPSVRYAALCQVMRWAGPILCVQRDPSTLVAGLETALDFFDGKECWVLGARPHADGTRVELLRIGEDVSGSHRFERSSGASLRRNAHTDRAFREALSAHSPVTIEGGWCLVPV